MNYDSWFASTIGADYIEEIDNDRLLDYCINLKNKNTGRTFSNVGGWQSNDLNFNDVELQELLSNIYSRLIQMKSDLGIKDIFKLAIKSMWVNINNRSNFNKPHCHPGSFISGVYYVDIDADRSGDIVFLNPNAALDYHWDINWFKDGIGQTISSTACYYKPKKTKLILFPGWLWHYVEPSNSDKERISISFNTELTN